MRRVLLILGAAGTIGAGAGFGIRELGRVSLVVAREIVVDELLIGEVRRIEAPIKYSGILGSINIDRVGVT